jgi:bifunctional oligoribonuclease and PAP phosphatase NrnA
MIEKLKIALAQAKKILITTHKSPDGDAIGSSVAWYHFLKSQGKETLIVLPDEPADFLRPFLQNVDFMIYEKEEAKVDLMLSDFDLVFCLDYNAPSRVGKQMEALLDKVKCEKVMIDHHQNPVEFCEIIISRPEICSTAQLIYECIEELEAKDFLNKSCCEAIYLGIMTDTGSFRYPSVTSKTHLILAHLIEMGVEHFDIHEKIFDVNTLDKIQLRAYAIANKFEKISGYPIGLISMSSEELQRFNYQKGDTEGLVNVILSIEGISIALFLMEAQDGIKMSFRSKGSYFVNDFAKKNFSGGGHKYAAGGFSADSLNVTISRFKALVDELIP